MKIAILKAGINPQKCINEFEYKQFPLSRKSTTSDVIIDIIPENLVDYDFFISDIGLLDFQDIFSLHNVKNHITDRIIKGGVLLCFTSEHKRFGSSYSNYSWLPGSDLQMSNTIQNYSTKEIIPKGEYPFVSLFEKVKCDMYSKCIFLKQIGNPFYSSILSNWRKLLSGGP
ncbi:hypothetical protein IID20_03045 [Patescibacteria group bacterium]|nr:hypothetical protein [Patescibacteria group bacterium]